MVGRGRVWGGGIEDVWDVGDLDCGTWDGRCLGKVGLGLILVGRRVVEAGIALDFGVFGRLVLELDGLDRGVVGRRFEIEMAWIEMCGWNPLQDRKLASCPYMER